MTNLAHTANILHREAKRLMQRADYLSDKELATAEYTEAVRNMGMELEEAACCIDRHNQIKWDLLRSRRHVLATNDLRPTKRIGVAVFELEDTAPEPVEETL